MYVNSTANDASLAGFTFVYSVMPFARCTR